MRIEFQDIEKINQNLEEMNDPLEPIKVTAALNSQIMVLDYRMNHKPEEVSVLDYTIIASLDRHIPKMVNVTEEYFLCPSCKKVVGSSAKYCKQCGQRVKY